MLRDIIIEINVEYNRWRNGGENVPHGINFIEWDRGLTNLDANRFGVLQANFSKDYFSLNANAYYNIKYM
jgi:hypothetical protein